MDEQDLSATEKLVCESFAEGRGVDLRSAKDPVVRAAVVRRLLLGGGSSAGAGQLASLRLLGARIDGELNLSYADVDIPISLREWSTWLTDARNQAAARRVYRWFGRLRRSH